MHRPILACAAVGAVITTTVTIMFTVQDEPVSPLTHNLLVGASSTLTAVSGVGWIMCLALRAAARRMHAVHLRAIHAERAKTQEMLDTFRQELARTLLMSAARTDSLDQPSGSLRHIRERG